MKLAELLAPLTVRQLQEQYVGKQCWLKVPRTPRPPTELLPLDVLEARLNDGCATLANLTVIESDGRKLPRDAIYQQQPAPSWTQEFMRKRFVHDKLRQGCSFVMHNMTHITPAVGRLIREIEEAFVGWVADVHVYASPTAAATGYRVHCDKPQHKLYIQLHGETAWTVFRGQSDKRALTDEEAAATLEVDFEATLKPGSVLYMPPGVFHRARNPNGPRVSLSIPFHPVPGSVAVDRHHIALQELMSQGS